LTLSGAQAEGAEFVPDYTPYRVHGFKGVSQFDGTKLQQPPPNVRNEQCRNAAILSMDKVKPEETPLRGFQVLTAGSDDPHGALEGRKYINSELAGGRPIMVGVFRDGQEHVNNSHRNDHFIVITQLDYDSEKKPIYTFFAPGAAVGGASHGTLRVDDNGVL